MALLFVAATLYACTSAYKTSTATLPSKEAKKKEAADRKALKNQIKKQKEKREKVEDLEYRDRTPSRKDKQKKGTPKSPETFY